MTTGIAVFRDLILCTLVDVPTFWKDLLPTSKGSVPIMDFGKLLGIVNTCVPDYTVSRHIFVTVHTGEPAGKFLKANI
jgi:hypothetical protein